MSVPTEKALAMILVAMPPNGPLHRSARASSRASVWKRWLGPSSGRDEIGLPFYLDFGSTAEPPFQSTGSISKVIRTAGELALLEALLVMFPAS